MDKVSHKPIRAWLHSRHFENLLAKLNELQTIEKMFKKTIPEELASYCQVANYRDSCLYLLAENAAWATRIRFLEPQIIKLMNIPELRRIHCMIKPAISIDKPKQRFKLSETSLNTLKNTASLSSNPLQLAWQRIIESSRAK